MSGASNPPATTTIPADLQAALDAVLACATDPVPRPLPQPDPYKPDPDYPERVQGWCEARGVKGVGHFVWNWTDALVRLADAIEATGFWRTPVDGFEPVPLAAVAVLRGSNLPAYLTQVTGGLLDRARRVAAARRTFERIRSGEDVSPDELAGVEMAKRSDWGEIEDQLRQLIHEDADVLEQFKGTLRRAVEEVLHPPEVGPGERGPGRPRTPKEIEARVAELQQPGETWKTITEKINTEFNVKMSTEAVRELMKPRRKNVRPRNKKRGK